MMESQGGSAGMGMDMNKLAKENTMELNPAHPIVVNLNQLRKTNKVAAGLVAKQLLDNVMVASGIPFNIHDGTERQYQMIGQFLELMVEKEPVQATRKEVHIDEPILKKAQNIRSASSDQKVTIEHTVGQDQK